MRTTLEHCIEIAEEENGGAHEVPGPREELAVLCAKAARCDAYESAPGLIPEDELGFVVVGFPALAQPWWLRLRNAQHARSTAAERQRCIAAVDEVLRASGVGESDPDLAAQLRLAVRSP